MERTKIKTINIILQDNNFEEGQVIASGSHSKGLYLVIKGVNFYYNVDYLKASPEYRQDKLIIACDLMYDNASKGSKSFGCVNSEEQFWDVAQQGLPIYEVIPGMRKQKFKIDFDFKPSNFQYEEQMLAAYEVASAEYFAEALTGITERIPKLVLTAHSEDKHSYHYVYPLLLESHEHAANMFKEILEKMPQDLKFLNSRKGEKMLDPGIYSSWQCFRTMGASKQGEDRPLMLNQATSWPEELADMTAFELFQMSLITNQYGCYPCEFVLPPPVVKAKKTISQTDRNYLTTRKSELLDQFLPPKWNEEKGRFDLDRNRQVNPGVCPVCPHTQDPDKRHESNGAFLKIRSNRDVVFYCYANLGAGGVVIDRLAVDASTVTFASPNPQDTNPQNTIRLMDVYDDYYMIDFLYEFKNRVFTPAEDGYAIVTASLKRIARQLVRADNTILLKESQERPFQLYKGQNILKRYPGVEFIQQKYELDSHGDRILDSGGNPTIKTFRYPVLSPLASDLDFLSAGVVIKPFHPGESNGTNKKFINIFPGYGARKCELTPEALERVNRFNDHIFRVWCRSDLATFDYTMTWLIHPIRYKRRTETCILLVSKQGAGKTSVLDILQSWVYGDALSAVAENIEELFDRFTNTADKMLVFVKEANTGTYGKSHFKVYSQFKSFVTDSKAHMEEKGIQKIKVNRVSSFIIAANDDKAMAIDVAPEEERRMFMLLCSNERKGDEVYWDKFYEDFDNQNFGNEYFTWCLSDDAGKYNRRLRNPPMTELKLIIAEKSKSPVDNFADDLCLSPDQSDPILTPADFAITSTGQVYIRTKDMYALFLVWCKANGKTTKIQHQKSFTSDLMKSKYFDHKAKFTTPAGQIPVFIMKLTYHDSCYIKLPVLVSQITRNNSSVPPVNLTSYILTEKTKIPIPTRTFSTY